MKSYAEFYVLLGKMPGAADGLKEELVAQFTGGRTTSLKDMNEREYKNMCASMRETTSGISANLYTAEIKSRRSVVLNRMQKLGIDTTVWANVDHFCMNPRIAGKRFAKLTIEELTALVPKLESMIKKDAQTSIPGALLNVSQMCWN